MDYTILQARILESVAVPFSRGSSQLRDRTQVSCVFCIGRWTLYHWATWECQQVFNCREPDLLKVATLLISIVVVLFSVQFSPVALSCLTLCDSMNRSTPGLPVHHHLPEFTQTHVHRVHDAIQPSHPRSSPSPPALNPSQHQSLFQWVNSSHEVAKVLEFQL